MSSNRWIWGFAHITHVLRYKKVSNTNQYNSKATRLAAYNAHKDDESEMEGLDPPHDHWKLLDKIATETEYREIHPFKRTLLNNITLQAPVLMILRGPYMIRLREMQKPWETTHKYRHSSENWT